MNDIFGQMLKEADVIHPDKKQWIEAGDPEINALLPKLSEKEKSYLRMITSANYKEMVRKIKMYTKVTPTEENLPSLAYAMMGALQRAVAIESAHKQYLEELALTCVFDVPEFKMVEDAYTSDQLRINAKLEPPKAEDLIPNTEAPEGGLSQAEQMNMDIAQGLSDVTEEQLKRRFANLMTAGGSTLKMHLFAMMNDKLKAIDKDLPTYYGILATMAQLGYWVMPDGIEMAAAGDDASRAGSSQVVPNGDVYTIKARAVVFPYLVHEIVKGVYEWLSLRGEHQDIMKKETIGQETRDMLAGPEVFKIVSSYLPADRQELLPLVQKLMGNLKAREITDVLSKSTEGEFTMKKLMAQAEKEWAEYQSKREQTT
jgi:hypothetical protein